MKKVLLAVITVLLLVAPAHAQGPIFLPLVHGGSAMPTCEDHWKLIVPEATTNLVLNPSAETTGNYAQRAGTTVSRATTYQHYGLYSYRVQTNAGNEGINITTATLANAAHYVTLRAAGDMPPDWLWSIGGVTASPRELETIDDTWTLYGAAFSAAACNGETTLVVVQSGAGAGDFYLDGIQVEQKTYYTTYADGTQDGCSWNGTEHASTSTRSAQSRAGGRVRDFWQDYHFLVERFGGTGMAPVNLSVDEFAILPGGQLNNAKTGIRSFTLTGTFLAENEATLYQYRQALLEELSTDRYPYNQPIQLRFNGATVHKGIAAHFEGGLEAQLDAYRGPYKLDIMTDEVETADRWRERVVLRFIAADPLWYEIGDSATVLDSNDSATFRYVARRLRSTGQWDDMGPPSDEGIANIYAIAVDDTYVYVGGDFSNFDGDGGADDIVRWNKYTEAWSALGTGTNGNVAALVIGVDGTLYAGGYFTTAGGGAANYVAAWDGTNWSALGAGMDADVLALAIGLDGTLYAGGSFTTAGGGAANYIAAWDGAAWSALGTGMNEGVYGLEIGIDGTLYVGGNFTTAGGNTANHIAAWNGTTWSALGTGMDAAVSCIRVDTDDTIYAGGAFINADGATVNYIAQWNGSAWYPLGSGVNNQVLGMEIAPNGLLYVGGNITVAGGLDTPDRIAVWNGASWAHLDVNFPDTPNVHGIVITNIDPVIVSQYDLYVGFESRGTGYYGGAATVTNDGIQPAYPAIVFSRSGGTTANLTVVRNETTGQELLFDYDLQDGETLTIDLTPQRKSITSSFFGSRLDAILPNSDFGAFALQPGANTITAFVNVAGAPTITAYMIWKDAYKSHD